MLMNRFWVKNEYEELASYSLFHAHSNLGTHLLVQLPSEQGDIKLYTGSGNLDLTSYDYADDSSIDDWNYWVLQSDLDSGLSRIFLNGNLKK
jgi:hypothetical protein